MDSKNWTNLGDNVSTPHFRRRFMELIRRFTGGNPSALLMPNEFTKLNLDHVAMKRLMRLCNAIEDDIKNSTTETSRDVIHLYTNFIACIVSTSKDKTPHTPMEHFKDKGWGFGRHRYKTARKRQREDSFCEVRPAKRGRKPITTELIKKIEDE